jgi:hypothetical protein
MEFLKLLNRRPYNNYTLDERTGKELGDAAKISARGDTVGPFDMPEPISTGGSGGGGSFEHAFKLTVALDGSAWKWQVSSSKSTVMDGTNGAAIDLDPTTGADWKTGAIKFDVATTISATKYICLQATADEELALTDWELVALDSADEVVTGGDPVRQTSARLLIGKIVYTSGSPPTAEARQAIFSAQRFSVGFLNGIICKIFEPAPIHPDEL